MPVDEQWQGTQGEIVDSGEADEPDTCYVEMPLAWFAGESGQYRQFLSDHDFAHFCQDYDSEIMHVNVGCPEEYSYIQGECSCSDAERAKSLGLVNCSA